MRLNIKGKMRLSEYENYLLIPIQSRAIVAPLVQQQNEADKPYICEIKKDRQKRSLDANAYCHALINEISEKLRTSHDEVYIEMLKRYGKREKDLVSVVADAASIVYKATKNHCAEVGESELNGRTFKHFAILIGSSQYDSKEMSRLIDGVVSEAKELDIQTDTPGEIARMKEKWVK